MAIQGIYNPIYGLNVHNREKIEVKPPAKPPVPAPAPAPAPASTVSVTKETPTQPMAADLRPATPAPTGAPAPAPAPVDYAKSFRTGTASDFNPKSPLDRSKMDALKAGDKNWADNKSARERMNKPAAPAASAPAPAVPAKAPATDSTAKPTMAADVKPNNAEADRNKMAMDNAPTGKNITKVLPDVSVKVKGKDGKETEVKRRQYETIEDSSGNKSRINPATGLPFGYLPGDKLPSGANEEMKTRAKESETRKAQSQPAPMAAPMAADVKPAANKKAPRPGSLEAADERTAQVKENLKKEYDQRQAQSKANAALWDAGDKVLKDAGIEMKKAPPSYDWARKQQAAGNYKLEVPKESRSEREKLEKFYNDNPEIKSKSGDRWRDGKPMSKYDEGTSGSKKESNYDIMMKKRTGPMSKR